MDIWVSKTEIKSTNVFLAKQMYIELHHWCHENNYTQPPDVDFNEDLYWDARQQDGSREWWIWWRPIKVIEGSQYWYRAINIDMHGVAMKQVEILHEGKKLKADKGKFELLIHARLVFDKDKLLENHPVIGPFFEIFWKRWYRREIEMWRKEVLVDMKGVQDTGRRFFELSSLGVPRKPFIPPRGFNEPGF